MESLVFVDNGDRTDPAFNLALEEYVLRQMDPERDYLLLYRNEPSVIVGRNQNVLEEVHDSYIRQKGIPILRRLSGGGTVYHDPQNLNFSFVTRYESSRLHNFRFFNTPVVRILRTLGVPAEMNDRNDILAGGRKISGSAQFSSKGRMYSHGTLLFNSELEELDRVLAVRMKHIRSKSHKSVRSTVANISEFLDRPMSVHAFREYLLQGLQRDGLVGTRCVLSDSDLEKIEELRESRYTRWEWNIGRSPKFSVSRSRIVDGVSVSVDLVVSKGHIEEIVLQSEQAAPYVANHAGMGASVPKDLPDLTVISNALKGIRYDPKTVLAGIRNAWQHDLSGTAAAISADTVAAMVYGEDPDTLGEDPDTRREDPDTRRDDPDNRY